MDKKDTSKTALEIHEQVPPGWYFKSLRVDLFQRYWHKRRFEEVAKVIESVKGKILDIGCADGTFSKVIFDTAKPEKLIGIDVVKTSTDWANKHWGKEKKMIFEVGDAEKLDYASETFNAVFALEMLEHVFDPKKVLSEIKRVLKKDGYGVFLVPSDSDLFNFIWFLWLHFYPRGWVWKETHLQSYRNNYLTKLCKEVGFKIEVDKKFILGMLHLVKVRKI